MKLKNIILVLVPLLLVIILTTSLYTSFKGNPFVARKATKAIKEYVAENYPEYELEIDRATYNFKFKSYGCKVYSNDIIDLHFTVKYNQKGNISYDSFEQDYLGSYNTLDRFGKEYTKLVTPVLENLFGKENINRAYIEYEKHNLADASTTPQPNEEFTLNDRYHKRLMVNLEGTSAKVEDFADILNTLHQTMIEKGYNVDDYTLYIEIDGRAYSVRDISPELINDDLLDLINKKVKLKDDPSIDVGFKVDVEE
jgi:hypothetical protein